MYKSHFFGNFGRFILRHKAAFSSAFVVGIICITPYIVFSVSLGDEYRGIPIMAIADEDYYLGRMQEILDGHPLASSSRFFEYKNQLPLAFTGGELFYALPAIFFHLSLVTVLVASKFFFPALFFLLIYFFAYNLSEGSEIWQKKLNAIAISCLVVFGYDLIDYRTVIKTILGTTTPQTWLLWARPVHPIMGAIFLFSFLLCVLSIIQKRRRKLGVVLAALSLSLMVYSYFFSWGIALSILFVLVFLYWLNGRRDVIKDFVYILLMTAILTLPYWYVVLKASQSPWYQDSVLHSGLLLTHYPLPNAFLIATLIFFTLVIIFLFVFRRSQWDLVMKSGSNKLVLNDWVVICLGLVVGGLVALNQQIVTGRTIWPFHFVQYTIPLSLVVIGVIFYNIIRKQAKILWSFWVVFAIGTSSLWGIFTQIEAYNYNRENYRGLQVYSGMLQWLDQQSSDCVALMPPDRILEQDFGTLLTAFTHCDTYANSAVFSILMPIERRLHNYYVNLRIKGITSENIEKYLAENYDEVQAYLFSNWKGIYGFNLFPDIQDQVLADRLRRAPAEYREFLKRNFSDTLSEYRLDYIVTLKPLDKDLARQLPYLKLMYNDQFSYVYGFWK